MSLPPPAAAGRHALPAELIHDLRTPLSHIIGYSEMLIEQAMAAGHDGYLADLQKVNAAGHRLLALMEQNFRSVRPPGPPAAAADAGAGPSSRS
jgi:signal transduction histidine kinase